LEKFQKKHKLTELAEEKDYVKYKPRQWESIEDKLRAIDAYDEVEKKKLGIPKDYVAQIREHI